MSFFQAGSGRSMGRLLYFMLTASFCAVMLFLAVWAHVFNAYESAAIATLAGGLSWAWVTGKKMGTGKDAQETKAEGTQDKTGGDS